MNKNINIAYFFMIGFGMIGAFLVMLWITPLGSGVSPDSTAYFITAKSIASGKGLSSGDSPVTHFPPLYPLILAIANLLIKNIVETARLLNALLFAINISLVAWLVYKFTDRGIVATVCAILFFMSSASIMEVHAWAWSEPLFIAFSLCCLIFLSRYIVQPSMAFFIASSIFAALAVTTRYVGVGFLPAAMIILFLFGNGNAQRRIRNLTLWAMIASAPLGLWLIRNEIEAGNATNRSMVYHPISILHLKTLFLMVLNFLIPISLSDANKILIFGLIVLILVIPLVIHPNKRFGNIHLHLPYFIVPTICFLFILFYTIFVFFSISFFDASTPIDTRIFSPVLVISIPGTILFIWALSKEFKKPIVWWCFLLVSVALIVVRAPQTIQTAQAIQGYGLGYTTKQWIYSETITFIKSYATDVKIYTNGPDVLSLSTEKQILYLPRKYSSLTTELNPNFQEEMGIMCRDIKENRALLVYFNTINWRTYFPTNAEIKTSCGIRPMRQFTDGSVY